LGNSWGLLYKILPLGLIVLSACNVKMRREDYLSSVAGAKINLNHIPDMIRGGDALPINLGVDSKSQITAQILEYSLDGVTYTKIADLPSGTASYVWAVPMTDLTGAQLRYTAKDKNNKTSVVVSNAFGIDSTPPTAPTVTLASAALTASSTSSFTVSDCTDRFRVLINSGATPTLASSGWVDCSTASGLLAATSAVEGAKTFSVWAMDEVGNISTGAVTSPSVTLDTTPPALSLTAPAGAEFLASGSSFNITWSASDLHLAPTPIKLEYTLNGGSSWTTIATAQSNTGTYAWTVPSDDVSNAQVRITAIDDVGLSTVKTSPNFTIDSTVPSVAVTAPNGSEVIAGGATYNITWTATDTNFGTTPVDLSYSTNSGSTWTSIATNQANSGTYAWTVPSIDSATVRVKVTATDRVGHAVSDTSDTDFAIDKTNPTLSLTSLTGGQVIRGGTSVAITWTASDLHLGATPIKIEYSSDNGLTWNTIAASTANSGTYSWSVPSIDTVNALVRVTATDVVSHATAATSATNFAIDTAPPTLTLTNLTGGQYIKGGVSNPITWSGSDLHATATPISLYYSTDGGSTWTTIATGVSNSGTYSWSTPSINSNSVRLKVGMADSAGNTSSDASSTSLTVDSVAPVISLGAIAGPYHNGQVVAVGFTLTETNVTSAQSILIEKTSNNGSTWATLASISALNGPLSSQSFSTNWTVDTWDTATAKVRVTYTDLAGWSTTQTSSAFTVDSTGPAIYNTSIATTAMKGGTNRTIFFKFSDGGSGLDPNAQLSTSVDGVTYAVVSSTIATDGSNDAGYVWTAPLVSEASFYIRIRAYDLAGNATTYVYSPFIVDSSVPSMSWTASPTNGQALRGGTTFNLGFLATDVLTSIGSLKLQYASDGTTFSDVATLATNATTYSWSVPTQNTTTAKLRLIAVDGVGNTETLDSFSFTIDSTAPAAPLVSLYSASPTNSLATTLTISDCTDRPYVLVNEGSQPSLVSATWVACTTAAGGISYTLANTQGTHTVKVWSQDAVGNISVSSGNVNVVYDSVAPVITLGAIPNPNAWDAAVTLNWTLTEATISDAQSFNIEVRENGSASWSSIATVASTFGPLTNAAFSTGWTVPHWVTTTAQVRVSITDLAGNSSSATSGNLTIDNYFPTVSLTGAPSAVKGGTTVTLSLSATAVSGTLSDVTLEYAADGSTFSAVQTWNPGVTSFSDPAFVWNVPSDNTTTAKLRLVATNTFPASSTSSSSAFSVDSVAPTLTAGQFTINSGATTTSGNNLKIALKATDNVTKITHFCLKQNTTAPLVTDACWKSVTASPPGLPLSINLNLSNFPYLIGFNPGTYTVYSWVKDEAGNISDLTNSGAGTDGTDKASITYSPPVAPNLYNVVSSARDAVGSPPDQVLDLTVPFSSQVYVKWKATDNAALPGNAIKISYTLDGVLYTPLASNLPNSQGAGCTVDGVTYTGCSIVPSPTSAAYSIRVTVLDAENQSTSASAVPLNTKPLNIIAGNTDPGFGGSATSAIMFQTGVGMSTRANALAVSASGKFFVLESRGLIVIDPADGLYKTFIPVTGSAIDGDVATATLIGPSQITMDYQDRLLIYDGDRIRRVDLETNTISTIIGGGGSTADGVSAASFAASGPGGASLFVPLPNGDLWFQISSEHGTYRNGTSKLRVYKASLDKVFQWIPTGTGSDADPGYDPTNYVTEFYGIRFDPNTSALSKVVSRTSVPTAGGKNNYNVSYDPITKVTSAPHYGFPGYWGQEGVLNGRSGEMYTGNRFESFGIFKFDVAGNWNRVVGTGGQGQCNDGTPATSCAIDLYTFYIGENEQIYFVDRGRIRTVDASGNILTLFGQSRSYGDGGNPASARFNNIIWMDRISDGRIVVKDEDEIRMREFSIGGTISTIAGTGADGGPDTTNPANIQPITAKYWGANYPMVVNPTNGNIYYTRDSSRISVLNRSTGLWEDLAGFGGTNDLSADGLPGNQISIAGYASAPIGFNGSQVIRGRYDWSGTYNQNGFLKLYSVADGTQSHFAGQLGPVDYNLQDCADGTPVANCKVETNGNTFTRFNWDSVNNKWIFAHLGSSKVQTAAEGGNISTYYNAPTGMLSFINVTKGANHYLYYCSTSNYHIRRYHLEGGTDVELPWPNNTIICNGWSMNWDPVRNTVIFPISQNGLMGIGEYNDP
jgi:hypothetical protein